jgi:phosphoribosyl-ATP pyrophosphohydrolase/phosphoribosyl-AMP cyclohydrolase
MEFRSDVEPDFAKMPGGLLPAIAQDWQSNQVLMLGYMDAEALQATRSSGLATFFSRSKGRLWTKGESSGNVLRVRAILLDCDRDTLLLKVQPQGPTCHTGADTCWGEANPEPPFLPWLEKTIRERRTAPPDQSYTAALFAKGIPKIAQKVGEEAVETVIEALGDDRTRLLNESADLLYHLLVLLQAKDCDLRDVEAVLRQRHKI